MALSGLFYTFEIVNSRFPDTVINIAFIFLGTALGSRLNGLKLKELFFYIFHGIIVCSILVIVAMITAYFLQYLGFDFIPTFLSFVHSSQRNLHYLTFPLQKTRCIFMVSLAKAVCSYSVLLGRMKTNAASLDETKVTAQS